MLVAWFRSAWGAWLDGDDSTHWPALLVSFLVLCLASFVMLWVGDQFNAQGAAVTRYLARVQAPLTAGFYPTDSRQRITVITYDDEFLQRIHGAWPISYAEHAVWLERLVADPEARPKAIFLDITFGQERDDVGVEELRDALCHIHSQGIPVFLAALASRVDGVLYVRPGLQAKTREGIPCFTLVGVRHVVDPVDGMTWSYPLTSYAAAGAWHSGPAPALRMPNYRSAAMAIAQDAAGIDLGEEREPMSLIWGARSQPPSHSSQGPGACQPVSSVYRQLSIDLWRQVVGARSSSPICPFHSTLSMAQIGDMDEAELAPYLTGTYLMIGAAVDGQNDFAMSPVQGRLPGVFVHAMALDNFLVYQDSYKRHSSWSLPPSSDLFVAGLLAMAAVFGVHIAFKRTVHRAASRFLRTHCSQRACWFWWDTRTGAPLWQRVLWLPLRLLLWALRLSFQIIAAMLLIVVLQKFFRIGMLPVVDLIGMTVLAEGLGYQDKIRTFFALDHATSRDRSEP
ncbi:CHASE2 domain-containing protein [Alcaligenaceae bacterium CGII-47]|nr:CHASE2 domain-containing protein [Alcaligenaceae bacterium CGII-47]